MEARSVQNNQEEREIEIIVRHGVAGYYRVPIRTNDTVRDIKVELEKQTGIPMEQQRLVDRGKEVSDAKVLDLKDLRMVTCLFMLTHSTTTTRD